MKDCDAEVASDASDEGIFFYLTVVRYLFGILTTFICKEGTTRSLPLLNESQEIPLPSSFSLGILHAYLPFNENRLADAASRFQQLADWHLHLTAFELRMDS